MGDTMRSTVKNAARLAVYDDIMMSVKNHHRPATRRVEAALMIAGMNNNYVHSHEYINVLTMVKKKSY